MSGTNPLILIIEDELATRRFLRVALASQGYRLAEAVAGRTGLAQAATLRPDLIILELELRDIDGLHVIEQLREWCSTPIVVLSARCQERAKVAALDAGADDYLTKPCSAGELLARMRVAQRRAAGAGQKLSEPIITIGELRMDLAMSRVFLGDVAVHLTPIEYRLDRVLYSPVHYPGDYRFIPQTYYDDGDPLDVLVVTNLPIFTGCVVEARLVGLFRMTDKGEPDDKILAVLQYDPFFADFGDYTDLPAHYLKEVEHFFGGGRGSNV